MKVVAVVLIFVAVFGGCLADYSEKQKETLNQSSNYCLKELNIGEGSDFQRKMQYGDFKEKDELTRKYITCTMKKLNFIAEDGAILKENLVDFLVDKYDRLLAVEVVDKCSQLKAETVEDKTNEFYDCFFLKKNFYV